MQTSREDVGIAIRSAFLSKGTKQRFSLFALIVLSVVLILAETIETKPLNYIKSIIKDTIYRGSAVVSLPSKGLGNFFHGITEHVTLYKNYNKLKEENNKLKNNISKNDFLELENAQLRKLIEEQISSPNNLVSARVMLDKQSPYINSFVVNMGTNKGLVNGLAALDEENFIGRVVDVNFFSSRILLVTDLNSKIPVIVEPVGIHGILSGRGTDSPIIEYLPENNKLEDGNKVYTSGMEGIFSPGMPIGEIDLQENGLIKVKLFSDLDQITFINVSLKNLDNEK
tara:strand:- start:1841 stop:2692 length:852 start_codon:yes stop_codon:yes gene_type:complete